MASSLPPVKGAAFTFYVSLVSQADTDIFKATPTLAAGDVQVSKDGGQFANVTNLPTILDLANNNDSGVLKMVLTATEMNADTVVVLFHDASGAEWQDALVTIYTAAQTLDTTDGIADDIKATVAHADYGNAKLVRSTTPANTLTVDASHQALALTNAVTNDAITAAAIANGAIDAATFAAGAINAAAIATGAIDADALAADAVTEIQSGLATAAAVADVPTVAEFEARTLLAASYFDPATDTVSANVTQISGDSTAADRLEAILDAMPGGAVVDDNDPDPTATAFETNLSEATNDHYNGAFVVFASGALLGQSRKISDYDGTSKVLTVAAAFTEAPTAGDTFLILGRSE